MYANWGLEAAGAMAGRAVGGMTGTSPSAVAQRAMIAAIFGGLASKAVGGSFHDGAITAAMTHLFNNEADMLILSILTLQNIEERLFWLCQEE